MEQKITARYDNLDYLRGLCALSILSYHYISWTINVTDVSHVLPKLGVYGVSLFYILSGLTMYVVYFNNFSINKDFFKNFYIKRLFRIYPLMWLVMVLALVIYGLKSSYFELFLQFSGLFGIVDWAAPVPLGVWSIGNELCFYLLLPLLFYCLKKGGVLLILISLIVFGIYLYFAFCLFDLSKPIAGQDVLYKNPFCQAGLFFGGILIGHFFKEKKYNNKLVLPLLVLFILAFVFYPVSGNAIHIIAGPARIAYTFFCFGITFCFFKADFSFISKYIRRPLSFLGDISYSLYLLHGHIWTLATFTSLKIRYVFPISVISTFIISLVVYWYFETPARKLGAKLINKKNKYRWI